MNICPGYSGIREIREKARDIKISGLFLLQANSLGGCAGVQMSMEKLGWHDDAFVYNAK